MILVWAPGQYLTGNGEGAHPAGRGVTATPRCRIVLSPAMAVALSVVRPIKLSPPGSVMVVEPGEAPDDDDDERGDDAGSRGREARGLIMIHHSRFVIGTM